MAERPDERPEERIPLDPMGEDDDIPDDDDDTVEKETNLDDYDYDDPLPTTTYTDLKTGEIVDTPDFARGLEKAKGWLPDLPKEIEKRKRDLFNKRCGKGGDLLKIQRKNKNNLEQQINLFNYITDKYNELYDGTAYEIGGDLNELNEEGVDTFNSIKLTKTIIRKISNLTDPKTGIPTKDILLIDRLKLFEFRRRIHSIRDTIPVDKRKTVFMGNLNRVLLRLSDIPLYLPEIKTSKRRSTDTVKEETRLPYIEKPTELVSLSDVKESSETFPEKTVLDEPKASEKEKSEYLDNFAKKALGDTSKDTAESYEELTKKYTPRKKKLTPLSEEVRKLQTLANIAEAKSEGRELELVASPSGRLLAESRKNSPLKPTPTKQMQTVFVEDEDVNDEKDKSIGLFKKYIRSDFSSSSEDIAEYISDQAEKSDDELESPYGEFYSDVWKSYKTDSSKSDKENEQNLISFLSKAIKQQEEAKKAVDAVVTVAETGGVKISKEDSDNLDSIPYIPPWNMDRETSKPEAESISRKFKTLSPEEKREIAGVLVRPDTTIEVGKEDFLEAELDHWKGKLREEESKPKEEINYLRQFELAKCVNITQSALAMIPEIEVQDIVEQSVKKVDNLRVDAGKIPSPSKSPGKVMIDATKKLAKYAIRSLKRKGDEDKTQDETTFEEVRNAVSDEQQENLEWDPELDEVQQTMEEEQEIIDEADNKIEKVRTLRKIKDWLKKNGFALGGFAASIAGLIVGLVALGKGGIKAVGQSVGRFGKAFANLAKKAGPVLEVLFKVAAAALSFLSKLVLWLSNNLWALLLFIVAIVANYRGYLPKGNKKNRNVVKILVIATIGIFVAIEYNKTK